MLVLSRYRDESIFIGDDVVITVVDIRGDRVRIGVQAPPDVSVHRQEVYEAIKSENKGMGSAPRKSERAPVVPSPVVSKPGIAPLRQELNKRKAKALPINIDPPVVFGGLTSDASDIVSQ